MARAVRIFSFLVLLALAPGVPGQSEDPGSARALDAWQRGHFDQALREYGRLETLATARGDRAGVLDALLGQAESLRAMGHLERAAALARAVRDTADGAGDRARGASARILLGELPPRLIQGDDAGKTLLAARVMASEIQRSDLEALALNSLGNHAYAQAVDAMQDEQGESDSRGLFRDALDYYARAFELAARTGSADLESAVALNIARLAVDSPAHRTEAPVRLAAAETAVERPAVSHRKAFALISLARLYSRYGPDAPDFRRRSLDALRKALAVTEQIGYERGRSYALGYLGELYERAGQREDAARLTRRALFAAQGVADSDLIYRWSWQHGRLLKAEGRSEDAIAAYRAAVHHLQAVRTDFTSNLAAGKGNFREIEGPVFLQLVDLLLEKSSQSRAPTETQRLLEEARGVIELSKAAELQDYFRDDCVAAQRARAPRQFRVPSATAVIYPILLEDRTEVLAMFADGSRRFAVPGAPASHVGRLARMLRDALLENDVKIGARTVEKGDRQRIANGDLSRVLPPAKALYDILVKPIEAELKARGVTSLVFVPDGALRTIPMGVLHDGTDYLVRRYALATTPGIALTETEPLDRSNLRILQSGLTVSVAGFEDLPNVPGELAAIEKLYPAATTLKGRDFVVQRFSDEVSARPFQVVHIASHGQLESDVRRSFVLAADNKITMDHLERLIAPSRYRNQPIELLTLSACQTAEGDDRASLGLAGIAVKAGARSALGSLWLISDDSTATLMSNFYRHLGQAGTSRAGALQQAQLEVLDGTPFKHPYFWAAFLMIGSWN